MAGWLTWMVSAALRDGPKKGKVVEVHRARQPDTGIVDEELLSLQTSAGTVLCSTRETSSLMGVGLESIMGRIRRPGRAIPLS